MNLIALIFHPATDLKTAEDADKLYSDLIAGKDISQDILNSLIDVLTLVVDGVFPPPFGMVISAIQTFIALIKKNTGTGTNAGHMAMQYK